MALRNEKFKWVWLLSDRIIDHRRECMWWKKGKPCKDCHFGYLTKIEEELEYQ